MVIVYLLLMFLGSIPGGAVTAALIALFGLPGNDITFWGLFLQKAAFWIPMFMGSSVLSLLLYYWNVKYTGEEYEKTERITYVLLGIMSPIIVFYAFFGMNPIWDLLKRMWVAFVASWPVKQWLAFKKSWKSFWVEKI